MRVEVDKEVICCVPSLFELQKGCWLLRLPPLLVDPWPATPLASGMHTKIRTVLLMGVTCNAIFGYVAEVLSTRHEP